MTPYKMITGGDYHHPIAMLGEIVLGKVPSPKGKMQRRWIKGVWLGSWIETTAMFWVRRQEP